MSRYHTNKLCKICNHPERGELESLYLMTKGENYRAFIKRLEDKYGVKKNSCDAHFRGVSRNGVKRVPHFVCDFSVRDMEAKMGLETDRLLIEKLGMNMVRKHLETLTSSGMAGLIKTSEAASMMNAVTRSADNRKLVRLKEKEIEDKDDRFNKMLNAALYGAFPAKTSEADEIVIRDAEVDDPLQIT